MHCMETEVLFSKAVRLRRCCRLALGSQASYLAEVTLPAFLFLSIKWGGANPRLGGVLQRLNLKQVILRADPDRRPPPSQPNVTGLQVNWPIFTPGQGCRTWSRVPCLKSVGPDVCQRSAFGGFGKAIRFSPAPVGSGEPPAQHVNTSSGKTGTFPATQHTHRIRHHISTQFIGSKLRKNVLVFQPLEIRVLPVSILQTGCKYQEAT